MLILIVATILFESAWVRFDFLSVIEKNYYEYSKKYPYVTIQMVFNQPTYAIGDTVFFAVRYQHENKEYVKGTHMIRLDLVSSKGNTAQSIRFKVTEGKGYNQIVLNRDLDEGIYKFFAYSDWMKNFGIAALFQKNIAILNKNQLVELKAKSDFIFFPEGGNLVAGIKNNILVVGDPCTELIIKDEAGFEQTRVRTDSSGVGSFTLAPQQEKKYFAHHNNAKLIWNLPGVQKDGIAINVNANSWVATISAPKQFSERNLFALVLSDGSILSKQIIKLNVENPFTLKLPESAKQQAIYQLYVIDDRGVEMAQRIFIRIDDPKIGGTLSINGLKKQKEAIVAQLQLKDEFDRPLKADMSISIFQEGLFPPDNHTDYLYLCEMPIVYEWARKCKRNECKNNLNTFLISERWNRINWEDVFKNASPKFPFPYQGIIKLKGKVINKVTDSPSPDSTLVIGFLQKNVMGYEVYTKNGFFEMPLVFDFWGDDQIFLTLRNKKQCVDDNYQIILLKDTIASGSTWDFSVLNNDDSYADFALKRNLISESYRFYAREKDKSSSTKSPNDLLEGEFQGVDHTINVTDYVVFPTMEDLLREVVTFVQFKKRGGVPSVRLFYRYEKSVTFYKNDPVYVIDGVMTSSTEEFLKLKPADLLNIKIFNNPNKLAQLGSLGSNGLIFVESRKGNLAEKFERNIFPVTGLSEPMLSTSHSAFGNHKVPDLRANILWIPFLNSDSNGVSSFDFTLSDDIGPMKICIQGLSSNGEYFLQEKLFTVEANSSRK